MLDAKETFGGTWPFKANYFDGNGFKMHYIDEGEGDPIVLVHGDPTWGYLWRNLIPPLSEDHRVIAADNMGFGKSETPRDRDYGPKSHCENLAALFDALDLENITLVVHDWGGFIGSTAAVLRPDRVKRIFLLNTLAGYGGVPSITSTKWFNVIRKHHEDGTVDELLGHLRYNVLSVMKGIGFENTGAVDTNWIDAYSAPFLTKEEAVGSIKLMLDAVLQRYVSYVVEMFPLAERIKAKPAMLVYGVHDNAISPDWQIADFKAMWPGRPIVKLPNAGHFSQEDAPGTIVALIQQFIQTT